MCCWTSFAALAGGCSPHRPSISLSIETVWLASRASIASTARCLAARSAPGLSATLASTGPSTRISIALNATLRLADCAPQGQLPAANRRATAALPARRKVVTSTDRNDRGVVMTHTSRRRALAAAATALLALAPSALAAHRAPRRGVGRPAPPPPPPPPGRPPPPAAPRPHRAARPRGPPAPDPPQCRRRPAGRPHGHARPDAV